MVESQEYICLFEELHDAVKHFPDLTKVYHSYAAVFYKLLTFNTQYVTIKFKGAYAKLSYLLKEHKANYGFTSAINDTRDRLRRFGEKDNRDDMHEELQENYLYDFEALCRLVALVYETKVPDALSTIFPPRRAGKDVGKLLDGREGVRMIAERWDDNYIYGTAEGEDGEVKVSYTHSYYDNLQCCWSYIKEYLFSGCQLNLVRPRLKDGVIVPELIIVEPDSLINISEIAGCFQVNATTYLNHLIRRLQPAQHTEAMLLGNLAGQLLDEEINVEPGTTTYADSVRKFFKSSAFNMLATETGPDFHKEAQRQKENIHRAFTELPSAVSGYDRSKVILEPSFFCPMLGIQGRVDLMQQDFKFLIEQKSGKSSFPTPLHPNEAPIPQTAHYVQILLYMMVMRYNFRDMYERNKRNIQCFLLYSKYQSSLCGISFAPILMFKAIRLRNAIAWAEDSFAKGGFSILDTLTAESFRQHAVSDKLWNNYIQPQIAQVLDPIHNASTLERKYFHRMLTFVANEHLLAKVGSNQRDDSGMAALWLSTLEEKRQAGNIFTDLRLISPTPEHKGVVEDVVLGFEQREDNGMCNFRKGDIVILYPYLKGERPDVCSQIINRCTLTDISPDRITLHLRAPQSNARLFTETRQTLWAVEHDFMESSYSSQYRGVHAFLSAPKKWRDLLLMQSRPQHNSTLALNGNYGAFNTMSLRVKQAQDIFLIIGPPGTGKTSFGMLNTLKEELTQPNSSVLITAYTNRAVDEICSKLIESGIDFIRMGSRASTDEAYHKYLIDTKVDECTTLSALKESVRETRVIVGTTTALGSNIAIYAIKHFDLLIIDEASQILEPHLLPLLCAMHKGKPAIKKMVMIGDHKQLPAVVKQSADESKVLDEELNEIGLVDCRLSLFERLLNRYGDDPHVTYMLTKQGRMHPNVAAFPNLAFYENKLDIVPLPHQLDNTQCAGAENSPLGVMEGNARVVFIPVAPDKEHYINDKVNVAEAEVIAKIVKDIYDSNPSEFDAAETIGIIVPYRNQIATVRNAISAYSIANLQDISIDTVERYQGSQRENIIYGFTVQKPYQLQFLTSSSFIEKGAVIDRRLNVAMTRAKQRLFLIGNPDILNQDPTFSRLIAFVSK